jgi:hypothetical protein
MNFYTTLAAGRWCSLLSISAVICDALGIWMDGFRRIETRIYGDSAPNLNAQSGDNYPSNWLCGPNSSIKCTVTVTMEAFPPSDHACISSAA